MENSCEIDLRDREHSKAKDNHYKEYWNKERMKKRKVEVRRGRVEEGGGRRERGGVGGGGGGEGRERRGGAQRMLQNCVYYAMLHCQKIYSLLRNSPICYAPTGLAFLANLWDRCASWLYILMCCGEK